MSKNLQFKKAEVSQGLRSKANLETSEYGKAEKGVIVCEICHDVYFKKCWHKPGSAPLQDTKLSGTGVHFALCPACKMKKENLFRGKLSIKNIPAETREELFNLISGFGRRAQEKNPQDRIMEIKTDRGNFVITTNNVELAVKIGKKVNETFHKTEKKVFFGSEPQKVSNVEINFIK